MEARLRGHLDVLFELGDQLERAQQILAREARRDGPQPLAVAFDRELRILGSRRVDLQHHQVAHEARQLAADVAQVVARFDQPAGDVEHPRRVLVGDDVEQVEQHVALDQAEHLGHRGRVDLGAAERHHLIERALRVAHAAFGGAGDQRRSPRR